MDTVAVAKALEVAQQLRRAIWGSGGGGRGWGRLGNLAQQEELLT